MNYLRMLVGAVLALAITGFLFFIMPALIEMADKSLDETPAQRIMDITMPDTKIEAQVAEQKPDKPEDPDEPPPDMESPEMDDVDVSPDAVNMTPQTTMNIDIGVGGVGAGDGEYLPIVKVAPIYPRRAQTRGVEGYCTVEYTVTKNGSIADPVAVDCQPQGYFESASIKAAMKFKYKPRVIDGEPIDVGGVQNRFTYELEK